MKDTLTAEQCRAARGLLNWTQETLAKEANVGLSTIKKVESGEALKSVNNLTAIRNALTGAGVYLIPENGGGAGVRLIKPKESGP